MTISSADDPVAGPFEGNGSQTAFPFQFKVFAKTDLEVVVLEDDTQTTLVLDSDYSVSLNVDQDNNPGGTITYPIIGDPLPTGATLTAELQLEATQTTDIQNLGGFYPQVIEDALDRGVLLTKQASAGLSRSLRFPLSEFGINTQLPVAANRALKTLTFDASGNPVCTAPSVGSAGALAADLLDDATPTNGSGMVGHSDAENYTDGVGLALLTRVFVRDPVWGITGDGVADDLAGFNLAAARAVALGVPLVCEYGQTFAMSDAPTLPAGLRLITNGATFKITSTTTGNGAFFDVLAGSWIDHISVSVPTGIRRDRCIRVTGDDVQIGKITLSSTDVQTTSEADDSGVIIRNGSRMWIGMIDVTNYDRGVIVTGTTDSAIGRVNVTGYVRGLYAWDNVNLKVMGGHIKTRSVNGAESAGHNGLLLACTAPASQRWCRFENLVIENAGEHAIRIGGDDDATPTGYHEHIWITNFAVYDCNGCGVKILGTNAVTPTARNKSIWLTGVIEDAGRGVGSGENRVGVLIQHADHVYLSVRVMKRDQTYSCTYPVYIDSAASVTLADCWLMDGSLSGVAMTCANGNLADINIIGGRVKSNGTAGLALTVQATKTATSVNVNGLAADSNGTLGFTINVSGTATDCLVGMKTYNNTTGAGACNSTAIVLQIVGDPGGTVKSGISAANGSTWLDQAAGNFYVLKAGTWTAAA